MIKFLQVFLVFQIQEVQEVLVSLVLLQVPLDPQTRCFPFEISQGMFYTLHCTVQSVKINLYLFKSIAMDQSTLPSVL